ncbi:MAG: hypothetical protein JJ864_16305 [Rhizobiaceae bacterium]|nr:hypothetical protein [Rhizobiaceae bacterium]
MNRFRIRALAASAILAASGYAGLAPSSAAGPAGFDPLDADPAAIAVAVRMPDRLHLKTGDVTMRIAFESDDKSLEFDEKFELELLSAEGRASPEGSPGPGEQMQVARVAAADRARLADTQAKARAARGKGLGALDIALSGGCRLGELAPEHLRVSTYMRTQAQGEFFALARDISLARALGVESTAYIPTCKSVP